MAGKLNYTFSKTSWLLGKLLSEWIVNSQLSINNLLDDIEHFCSDLQNHNPYVFEKAVLLIVVTRWEHKVLSWYSLQFCWLECRRNPRQPQQQDTDTRMTTIPKKSLFTCWPTVAGFSFSCKKWGEILVSFQLHHCNQLYTDTFIWVDLYKITPLKPTRNNRNSRANFGEFQWNQICVLLFIQLLHE